MKKTMANWNLFRIVYPKDGYGSEEVYLADSQGEVLSNYDNSPGTITLGKDLLGKMTHDFYYTESVYDVKDMEPNETFLGFSFMASEKEIPGNWTTTFKIESVKDIKTVKQTIELDTWTVDKISLSPMGVTLHGKTKQENFQNTPVEIPINRKDGSTGTYNSVAAPDESKKSGFLTAGFMPSLPLDVSEVKSITINGTIVDFK